MKTKLLATMVLAALTSAASAQSTLTIGGVLDEGLMHEIGNKADGPVNSLTSGIYYGSRLFFKGVEDLGGGMSAGFWLENGLLADTGMADQGGTLWGRQAYVMLKSGFGTVRLGRQYVPIHSANIAIDPFEYAVVGGYLGLVGLSGNGGSRANNAVKYISPKLGGVTAEVLYGFGEAAGDNAQGRQFGFNVGYAEGPLTVSLAHHDSNNGSATAPVAKINSTRNTALGGTYDFGVAKVAAIYQKNKDDLNLDTRDWLLGVSIPFGANKVLASYAVQTDNVFSNADTKRLSLGYVYALSKRTNFYAMASRTANERNARVGLAPIASGGSPSGTNYSAYAIGVRHFF